MMALESASPAIIALCIGIPAVVAFFVGCLVGYWSGPRSVPRVPTLATTIANQVAALSTAERAKYIRLRSLRHALHFWAVQRIIEGQRAVVFDAAVLENLLREADGY